MEDSQEVPPKIGGPGRSGQESAAPAVRGRPGAHRLTSLFRRCVTGPALALLVACAPGEGGDRGDAPAAADSAGTVREHGRELVFVGRRDEEPLVAALDFLALDIGPDRARELRGWVAHGNRWETFLDERWTSAAHGSAWTIVPHGPLRVAAGGPGELEALWYSRGGRNLRIQLGGAVAQLNHGSNERAHLFSGTLRMGGETAAGTVLELLQLRGPGTEGSGARDHLLLTSGDSLTLYIAHGPPRSGPGVAWIRTRTGTREWSDARVARVGERPLPEARRQIPQGWEIEIPEAGIRAQLSALGFTTEIGRERAGLRAVDARYTVSGSMEFGGRSADVIGMVLHQVE